MHPRAAKIDIDVVATVQYPRADQIHRETTCGYEHHWPTANDRRFDPTLICTVENQQRYHYQCDAIHERSNDLETVIAEGLFGSCGTRSEPDRTERQNESGDVGEHVSSVSQQREGAGPQCTSHFCHHVQRRQNQHHTQTPPTIGRAMMMVVIGTHIRVSGVANTD